MRELASEEALEAEQALLEVESALRYCCYLKTQVIKVMFSSRFAPAPAVWAAIFSGDLFRMYHRYAEQKGWSVEVLSERTGERGGYKELITRVVGQDVYSH